jgi:4-hydroxy-2-oxoheptanedioate aldolase
MTLRELWDSGDVTVGGWCGIPSPFVMEVMGRAGFDWICIDTQHGLIGYDTMLVMLEAGTAARVPCFVRVSWNQSSEIMKALDAGAQGVIVPMVNSAAEASAAVSACRYPPEGFRSWGPTRASLGNADYTPATGNRSVVCAVMVETAAGVNALDEIVSVPGVDAVFVGPADLAVTHGMPPTPSQWGEAHDRLVRKILAACERAKVTPGISCPDAESAVRWRDMGYRMLAVGSDVSFVRAKAADTVVAVRGQSRAPREASIY